MTPGRPCSFYTTPTEAERQQLGITDPAVVLGCDNPQGDGPLWFFVPVEGGAVRVAVCEQHAEHLRRRYV